MDGLSFIGDRHASRVGASILTHCGLSELLLGKDQEEYISKACALASDQEQIISFRKDLRGKLKDSPLCNGKAFADKFEKVIRELL